MMTHATHTGSKQAEFVLNIAPGKTLQHFCFPGQLLSLFPHPRIGPVIFFGGLKLRHLPGFSSKIMIATMSSVINDD